MTMRKEGRRGEECALVGYPRGDTFSLCRLWHEKKPFSLQKKQFISLSSIFFCISVQLKPAEQPFVVRHYPLLYCFCILCLFVFLLCLEFNAKGYKYRELTQIESFPKRKKTSSHQQHSSSSSSFSLSPPPSDLLSHIHFFSCISIS